MNMKQLVSQSDYQRRIKYCLGVFVIIVISWLEVFDRISTDYVDSALVDAGVAFGLARAFNALFSTAQSITFNIGLGAGVDVALGELLAPVNALVEDFSHVMKLSIGSLALQKVLLLIVSDMVFKVGVTLAGLAAIAMIWLRRVAGFSAVIKIFWTLVFLRFVLVAIVLLNGSVDRVFLDGIVDEDVSKLDALPYNLEEVSSDISLADRAAFEDQVGDMSIEIAELQSDARESNDQIVEIESDISLLEREKSEIQSEQGLVERFNYFSDNEELQPINSRLADLNSMLNDEEERYEELSKEIEGLTADKELIESLLRGESQGFLGMLSGGVSSAMDRIKRLGEVLNPYRLMESFESSVDTIMRLMAVFLFKTLVLPLLFLYVITRFFNQIWKTQFAWTIRSPNNEPLDNMKDKEAI